MAILTKTARLETRLTKSQREIIERAAELSGMTISDFVVTALQTAAEKTVSQYEVLNLTRRDQEDFADLLLSPPEANQALKSALKAESSIIKSET